VTREELVPLDEWEALKNKAEAGCSKHGDGPCDCGARQGKTATGDEDEAEEMGAVADVAVDENDEPQPFPDDDSIIDLNFAAMRNQNQPAKPEEERGSTSDATEHQHPSGGHRRGRSRRNRGKRPHQPGKTNPS
jgi:hypothetical protein